MYTVALRDFVGLSANHVCKRDYACELSSGYELQQMGGGGSSTHLLNFAAPITSSWWRHGKVGRVGDLGSGILGFGCAARNSMLFGKNRLHSLENSNFSLGECSGDISAGRQYARGSTWRAGVGRDGLTSEEVDKRFLMFEQEKCDFFEAVNGEEVGHSEIDLDKEGSGASDALSKNRKFSVAGTGEKTSQNESAVSSSFDVLELRIDLEREKKGSSTLGSQQEDDDTAAEGSQKTDLQIEECGELVGPSILRSSKQILRRSNMLAKQVISMQSALGMGYISQLWVDTRLWAVLLVEVRPSLLSGEMDRFLLEDVCQVGDVVLVQDESVLENQIKMIGLDTLVGYNVVTVNQRNVGKVRGYTFDVNSGAVELLELDAYGISLIPSSLVSTYGLLVEDVMEVVSGKLIVHEDAVSHLQKLTKGFFDSQNMANIRDEEGYRDPPRRRISRSSRMKSGSRRVPRETRGVDAWDLPMDF